MSGVSFERYYYILVNLCVAVTFFSCDLTYKVRNQHNDIEEILYTPCGKIIVELIGRGNSKFVFSQKFNSDNIIVVYPDSLRIFYNDFEIDLSNSWKNGGRSQGKIEINGEKTLETSFQLQRSVFEGDTIKVFALNYIKCKDQLINLDTVVFAFINNLRIYGVNEF